MKQKSETLYHGTQPYCISRLAEVVQGGAGLTQLLWKSKFYENVFFFNFHIISSMNLDGFWTSRIPPKEYGL